MNINKSPLYMALPTFKLQPYIQCYWIGEDEATDAFPIVPDGCIDLVFRCRGERNKAALVYGSSTRYSIHSIQADHRYIGLRFKPGQARHFLDIPASELTDANVDLNSSFMKSVQCLIDEENRVSVLQQIENVCIDWISKRDIEAVHTDRLISHLANHPLTSLQDLCFRSGISDRHFRRQFKDIVGVTPKLFTRIQRAHQLKALLEQKTDLSFTELSYNLGYSDQSHMQRDYKTFFGETPGQSIKYS